MFLLNRETLPQSQVGGGAGGGGGQIHTNPSEELAGNPGNNKMRAGDYGILGAGIGIFIVVGIACYYIVGWCRRRNGNAASAGSGDSGIELQIQNPAFNHSTATTLNAKSTPNAKSNFPEENESASTLLPDSEPLGLPSEGTPFPLLCLSHSAYVLDGEHIFEANSVAAPPTARPPTAPSTPVVVPPPPPSRRGRPLLR